MFLPCFALGITSFRFRTFSSITALILAANTFTAAEETSGDLISRAQKEFSRGRRDAATALATKAIETDPKNPRAYFVRAGFYEEGNEPAKALTDYDQTLKLDPGMAQAWQNRGILHFKLAHIDESISDFDQFLKLNPAQAPFHWQRGICYYYAQRFEEGRKQFELHQTVNPNDVENAAWHFLCVARSAGLEKARASLIPIREDARVPMMQIHSLFSGTAKSEDVLKAADAGQPVGPEHHRRLFYAHLYLGLYSEAVGDETQAREHITKAAREYGGADYMSDVARVHLILRESKKKSRANP
jgi:lipoprotein NlpI